VGIIARRSVAAGQGAIQRDGLPELLPGDGPGYTDRAVGPIAGPVEVHGQGVELEVEAQGRGSQAGTASLDSMA
jgi:hypothetical protein